MTKKTCPLCGKKGWIRITVLPASIRPGYKPWRVHIREPSLPRGLTPEAFECLSYPKPRSTAA